MAAKIVRQANRIALLGSPTSAAALAPGHEAGPSALRAAGLVSKLQAIGYEVADLGDDPVQIFRPDEETPRARNLSGVVAALEALKPRVEHAVKSAALPLILGGDCSIALATVAGLHRYFRNVALIYMDRDADLNTPATTRTGSLDGMVVSHLTGRGAAELVRFGGEPPLVREPDLAIFGVDRLEPAEEELLSRLPLRRYLATDVQRMGAAAAAQLAVERIHGGTSEFVLHLDVDVIADFQATDYPGSAGLSLDDVRAALEVFAVQKHLAAIEVAGYHPGKDADGSGASTILDLLQEALKARLAALQGGASVSAPGPVATSPAPAPADSHPSDSHPPDAAGTNSQEAVETTPQAAAVSAPGQESPAVPAQSWSSESLHNPDADSSHQATDAVSADPDLPGRTDESSS